MHKRIHTHIHIRANTHIHTHMHTQGENVHWSAPNTSAVARPSFSLHCVESAKGCEWSEDNWLQRPEELPFLPMFDSHEGGDHKQTERVQR